MPSTTVQKENEINQEVNKMRKKQRRKQRSKRKTFAEIVSLLALGIILTTSIALAHGSNTEKEYRYNDKMMAEMMDGMRDGRMDEAHNNMMAEMMTGTIMYEKNRIGEQNRMTRMKKSMMDQMTTGMTDETRMTTDMNMDRMHKQMIAQMDTMEQMHATDTTERNEGTERNRRNLKINNLEMYCHDRL